jgi:hypothetical protein
MKRAIVLAAALGLLASCGPKPAETAEAVELAAAPEMAPAQAAPAVTPVEAPAPQPVADPLSAGSQSAKDDLYCAGVILAAHPQPLESVVPVESAIIMRAENRALALSIAGTGKLIDEKITTAPQAGVFADAHAEVAVKDSIARKTRIPLEDCEKRADKLMQ